MSQTINILIIDDSPDDNERWERYLKRSTGPLSYNCTSFFKGKTALDFYESNTTDCILLDYHLPDYNANKMIEKIENLDGGSIKTPIVVLTGQGDETIATSVLKKGAMDYLVKDLVTQTALERAITNALEKKKLSDQLEEKNKEMEFFTYAVAHDLRAPLNRAQNYCDLLEKVSREDLSDKAQGYLKKITSDIQFSINFMEDILGFISQTPRSEKILEHVNLNHTIQTALSNLELSIKEKAAVVTANPLPMVRGDEVALVQLFQNLISNALKFTKDKPPTIDIKNANDNENYCVVHVQDNGIGIAPEDAEKIFKPLVRLHGRSDYVGSGIGLANCKVIVDQHKGHIVVQSTPGEGSTFSVFLPR